LICRPVRLKMQGQCLSGVAHGLQPLAGMTACDALFGRFNVRRRRTHHRGIFRERARRSWREHRVVTEHSNSHALGLEVSQRGGDALRAIARAALSFRREQIEKETIGPEIFARA
jgi:hypothetical protein